MLVDLRLPLLSTEIWLIEREEQKIIASVLRSHPTRALQQAMPALTTNMAVEVVKSAKATEEAALAAREKRIAYAAKRFAA